MTNKTKKRRVLTFAPFRCLAKACPKENAHAAKSPKRAESAMQQKAF
jgi:hypothetical protein